MSRPPLKYLSSLLFVLLLSASCFGFLVGRTAKMHEEGRLEQVQEMGEQIVTAATVFHRGVEVVKRVMLR